jgi:hypothetical protein
MKRIFSFLIFVYVLISVGGCTNRPSNMPDVFPCIVTVKKDNVPIDKVLVTFSSEDGTGTLRISGITDSKGKAKIVTQLVDYSAEGVPLGTYKVAIQKFAPVSGSGKDLLMLSDKEAKEQTRKFEEAQEKNRIVPEILMSMTTTPIKCIVKEKAGISLTVSVNDYK